MKSIIKKILFLLIFLSGLPIYVRKIIQKKRATFIVYHDTDPAIFEKHIRYLLKRYNLISLKHYIEYRLRKGGSKLPPYSAVIVFDDGHKNNYSLLPIFKKYNIPVTIFLASGIIGTSRHFWMKTVDNRLKLAFKCLPDSERLKHMKELYDFDDYREYDARQALSLSEINEMSPYVDFQSHTVTHPCLSMCSAKKSLDEICESKIQLQRDLLSDVYAIAYPNGDYTEREVINAKISGYRCALTMDWGFNSDRTDIYKLKRNSATDNSGLVEFVVKITGIWWMFRSFFRIYFDRLEQK